MLKLIQITDCHLYADSASTLKGVNTLATLQECLALAQSRHPHTDLVLATGDLAHDGDKRTYQQLAKQLKAFNANTAVLAGNHDNRKTLETTLGKQFTIDFTDQKAWRIIMLNSAVNKEEAGFISQSELDRLDKLLQQSTALHIMICLHHHVMPSGSQWLDGIMLKNPEQLFAVIDHYTHVRAVVCGHVHQAFIKERQQVKYIASPSTCIQFKPEQKEFLLDTQAPGYRWFELEESGEIKTGVDYLDNVPRLEPDAKY